MTASSATPPRLPLVDAPDDPLARDIFGKLAAGRGILNLHRMMAYAPALLKASGDMAIAFRDDAVLSRPLAEIAVLRAAQVVDCDYVFKRHLPLARAAGVSERQIADIARWPDSAAFNAAQKTALGYTEKVARGAAVDDASFASLRRDFSPREIVALTMLVAFYVSTATFIKALQVPDETE